MHDFRVAVLALCLLAGAACGSPDGAARAGTAAGAAPEEPGILYVLDPNDLAPESRVLAIDVTTGEVVRTYDAGRDPGFALSPDGTRLYLASRSESGDTLQVVDTATGTTIESVPLERRWMSTLPANLPTLELSADGRWLYVLQSEVTGPGAADYSVATFDTRTARLLPRSAPLNGCGGAALLPPLRGAQFVAVCHGSHDARFVTVAPDGAAESAAARGLSRREDERTDELGSPLDLARIAWAASSPAADTAYAVTQNGRVSVIDVASRRVTSSADLDVGDGSFIPYGVTEVSPAGAALFVGLRSLDAPFDRLTAQRVLVVDTGSWENEKTIETSVPFQSLVSSRTGRYLYAISTTEQSIAVIDVALGEEIDVIEDVGKSPTLGAMPAATTT